MNETKKSIISFDINNEAVRTEYWVFIVFGVFSFVFFLVSMPLSIIRITENGSLRNYILMLGSGIFLFVSYYFLRAKLAIQKTVLRIESWTDNVTFTLFDGKIVSVKTEVVLSAPLTSALASRRGSAEGNFAYQFMQLLDEKVCIRSDWLPKIYELISKTSK